MLLVRKAITSWDVFSVKYKKSGFMFFSFGVLGLVFSQHISTLSVQQNG